VLLSEGEEIRGVYEVDRLLGEGAFAEVYRVKHKFLGRQAMKVFKAPSPELGEIEHNLAEAVLLSKIGHPNIIRVFDAGILETSAGKRGYFTMEYVPGGTLESLWSSYRYSFLPIADTVDITRQVCTGMAVAHSRKPPVIHRDIKPQNILVGYDVEGLRVRISDFGLAKAVNPLTLLASARGTPVFKPPECLQNIDSCAGDVWSIGVTLYLLLTDHLPFRVESRMDLSTGRCWKDKPLPARQFNPRVDEYLESIISRCLQIKPSDRYCDAIGMLEDLRRWKPSRQDLPVESMDTTSRSKNALGSVPKPAERDPQTLATEAMRLAGDPGKLMEAADLLEEAMMQQPTLRERYEYQLRLWRRGIVM
jgi:eukaryotic-like serine/threonine-protein kinase